MAEVSLIADSALSSSAPDSCGHCWVGSVLLVVVVAAAVVVVAVVVAVAVAVAVAVVQHYKATMTSVGINVCSLARSLQAMVAKTLNQLLIVIVLRQSCMLLSTQVQRVQ